MNASFRLLAVLLFCGSLCHAQFGMWDFEDAPPEPQAPFEHHEAAAKVLSSIREAHRTAGLIQMTGTVTGEWTVMGRPTRHLAAFKTQAAPGRLLHTIEGGPSLIVEGTQSHVHFVDAKQYAEYPGVPVDANVAAVPAPIVEILIEQNPAALLVLAGDAENALLGASPIAREVDPIDIGGKAMPALEVWRNNAVYTIVYDPSTKLLRQVRADLLVRLTAQGVADVEKASLVIDYTEMARAPIPADPIAWSPPRDARLIGRDNPTELIQANVDTLQGRPAPQFSLKSLAGEDVSLADLKGSVVVLDFWATWCPPCREGLPHIAKLHAAHKDAGVRVYAVNVRETQQKIRTFLEQQKLDLPVLLDADGAVAQRYGVSGIPTTVVIGRDGQVQKVFVGFSPEIAKSLDAAVEAAMAR